MSIKNSINTSVITADEIDATYVMKTPVYVTSLPTINNSIGDIVVFNDNLYYYSSSGWVQSGVTPAPPGSNTWVTSGNTLQTQSLIGSLNNYDVDIIRNGVSKLSFASSSTLGYQTLNNQNYLVKSSGTPTANEDLTNLQYIQSNYTTTIDLSNNYLKLADASNNYLKIVDASNNYLNKVDASNNYLKIVDASNNYLKIINHTTSNLVVDSNLEVNNPYKIKSNNIPTTNHDMVNLEYLQNNYTSSVDLSSNYVKYTGNQTINGDIVMNKVTSNTGLVEVKRADGSSEGGQVDLYQSDNIGKWSIDSNGTTASQDLRIYRQNNGGSAEVLLQIQNNGNVNVNGGNLYSGNLLLQHDSTNAYVRPINSGSSLYLGASNTNFLHLNSSGQLFTKSIAVNKTTSIVSGLDVSGICYFTQKDINSVTMYIDSDNNNKRMALYTDANGGGINCYNYGSPAGALDLLLQATGGKVGIGEAPGHKLQIGNTQTASLTEIIQQSQTLYLKDYGSSPYNGGTMVFGASQGYFCGIRGALTDGNNNTKGVLCFGTRTNSTDANISTKMVIDNLGNVGIGNNTPQYKLDVSGQLRLTYSGDAIILKSGTTTTQSALHFYDSSDNSRGFLAYHDTTLPNNFYMYNAKAGSLVFGTNGTEDMYLNSDHKLLIGSDQYSKGKIVVVDNTDASYNLLDASGSFLELLSNGATLDKGGIITLGNTIGRNAYIKAVCTSTSNNTTGDLVFGTRTNVTDTTMTQKLKLKSNGDLDLLVGDYKKNGVSLVQYKAYCKLLYSGGTLSIDSNYKSGGITSINRVGAGHYEINLSGSAPSAGNYYIAHATTYNKLNFVTLTYSNNDHQFDIYIYDGSNYVDADIFFTCF